MKMTSTLDCGCTLDLNKMEFDPCGQHLTLREMPTEFTSKLPVGRNVRPWYPMPPAPPNPAGPQRRATDPQVRIERFAHAITEASEESGFHVNDVQRKFLVSLLAKLL